jgi:dTDP-4-amino-4,6-dideoxygalactose transaminase
MTDIQAAVGREQLTRLPAIVERRRALAARYSAALGAVRSIVIPREREWARSNWQSYAVRLAPHLDQRAVMQRLLDAGISTRRGVMNAHREAAYPAESWRAGSRLEHSEDVHETAIILPLFHQLTEHDQDTVIEQLKSAVTDR